jgi:hypothetical protein
MDCEFQPPARVKLPRRCNVVYTYGPKERNLTFYDCGHLEQELRASSPATSRENIMALLALGAGQILALAFTIVCSVSPDPNRTYPP